MTDSKTDSRVNGCRRSQKHLVRVPKEDIDLALAISGATARPGVPRTLEEIAAFCGCRRSTIWMIENRALRKLKKAIFLRRDPVLMELMADVLRHPNDEVCESLPQTPESENKLNRGSDSQH